MMCEAETTKRYSAVVVLTDHGGGCNNAKVGLKKKKKKDKKNKGGRSFTGRCASLVKEQRARMYILRRCATMLLCWYIHGDD